MLPVLGVSFSRYSREEMHTKMPPIKAWETGRAKNVEILVAFVLQVSKVRKYAKCHRLSNDNIL